MNDAALHVGGVAVRGWQATRDQRHPAAGGVFGLTQQVRSSHGQLQPSGTGTHHRQMDGPLYCNSGNVRPQLAKAFNRPDKQRVFAGTRHSGFNFRPVHDRAGVDAEQVIGHGLPIAKRHCLRPSIDAGAAASKELRTRACQQGCQWNHALVKRVVARHKTRHHA